MRKSSTRKINRSKTEQQIFSIYKTNRMKQRQKIEMTSPSSSIVVVDKSGSVDASNLIQTSQHVHQVQHQPIRAQQVILNEEYLSGDNIVRTGNVNYLIPMSNSTASMLKPSTISQHPNSKVHVISNLTLVSKSDQTQPQTINFVNSKQLQTSSASIGNRASITGGNYVNISTKNNKMFKPPTITQLDQTHIVSAQQQPTQQQHIITKHLNNASAIVQKVIPRNILVSTGRIQNKVEPTTLARATVAPHQVNQMSNVIQIQKSNTIAINKPSNLVNNVKSTKLNQQAIKLVNQSIGGGTAQTTATIKQGSVVKTITSTAISSMSNANLPKNQAKTSYAMQNSKAPQLHPKTAVATVHSNISTHRNNNNNINTINANTKLVQHSTQRTVMSMNNMCVPNVIGQKVTTMKTNSAGKYVTQTNPNIATISQAGMSTAQYRTTESLPSGEQRVTTYRTIQPSEARPASISKSITVINHPIDGQQSKKDADWSQYRQRNGVEIGYHDYQSGSDGKKSTSVPRSVDDVIMVNGTHMSEEVSARILQSLSQKVVFHSSNNTNSNSTSANSNRAQPVQSHRNPQFGQHRAIQPAVYKPAQSSRSYDPNKNAPEYFRVNTSDIQPLPSATDDHIPLVSTRGDQGYSNSNDLDDDIIGEEVRPKPIDSSMDSRMRALHALLQDHTYVQWPVEKQAQLTASNTSFASSGVPGPTPSSSIAEQSTSNLLLSPGKSKQTTTSQSMENLASSVSVPSQAITPNVTANKYQQRSNTSPLIPGYPFGYNAMMNKDDDANSAISNGSRNKSDIDQGEETETAPEAGNEDDSVTRCICELAHDDGYMICCDKCSVWQHVDCMGIDRQNIPEEYKCELCQPREIDQNRARTLQLMKRKEQQNFLMMKPSGQISGLATDTIPPQASNIGDRTQLNAFSTIVANKKKGTLSSKSRKGDLFGAKHKRSDSSRGGKRRDSKKLLSKRKSQSGPNSTATTPVKPNPVPAEADKQATNLRQWIENYEAAMTNHYSPELRARLQSIMKQMSSSTTVLPMLKNVGTLDSKCTTVPHAGAKILISTREIAPNNPVIEIRGKYMLTTQYKPPQQIGSPTSANGTRNFSKHNPGPFLFFYRLPNDGQEICVDTRTYGNEARFVRRSCRPNAEIVHSIEKGTPHLYIVSLNTIRSSTEITIKHEQHDLESLERGEINAPSSTSCGCGLIKDCIFALAGSTPSTSQPGTPTSSKKSKKPNGHIKDKSSPLFSHRKKSKGDKTNRNPSDVPSSSNSNASALPVDDIDGTKLNETAPSKPSTEKVQKDNADKPHDKSLRKNNNTLDGSWLSDTKSEQSISSPSSKLIIPDVSKIKEEADAELTPSSPIKIESKPDRLKSPPSTPISISNLKSPSSKSAHKKMLRKSTCSLSEDTGDEYPQASTIKTEKDSKSATENKKMTREERKMEAIVRAFEKMEKTEQRKNEQKKSAAPTTSTSSAKKRISSSFGKDDDKSKKSNSQSKRKRKRGKSYSQSSGQKRRRNRFDSHNSDDGNTSDESSTSMMSPSRLHDLDRHPRDRDKGHNDNLAAGLLLSLSTYGLQKVDKSNCLSSPERYSTTNKSQSNTPPFAVSSACLLIEAAVGPLDNDFKQPTKAKTKKTIMNEWLHQSDGAYGSQNHEQNLLSASTSLDYNQVDSNTNSYSHDEPRNLSIAAQKIEEFIHLTSGEHMDDDECSKWSGSPLCTSSDAMTVPTPLPTPPLQMGSSVKKRWLRQAISEECSDELLASSATSSPPNGFMAPLKKRRFARQCSDLNAEDIPSPKDDSKDTPLEDETMESTPKLETETATVPIDDETKTWHEVDIKVESETETKPPKDESDAGIKPDTTETQPAPEMADIDKFEPIESDEDDEMCLDIKNEIEDSQDKSMDAPSFKEEQTNEDSKSQDPELPTSSNELKVADENDFDIEDKKSDIPEVLPKNEIEDIQQKLHSFHSENLMILQTRNKKRASRATTPTSLDEVSSGSASSKEPVPSSSAEFTTKSRKYSTDERDYKHELTKPQNDDETVYQPYQPTSAPPSAALLGQPISSTHSYPPYVMNSARIEGNVAAQMYTTATPPPAAFSIVNATSNALYHYLENPTRPTGYNTGYNSSHIFSVNTSMPPPTLLNSSNYLTKNYTTLSEPTTPVAIVPSPVAVTPSSSNSPINPKVLTRTQSADPRLNPQKDLPPVTPKRKLSINEYRKRKQLTTSTEKQQNDGSDRTDSTAECSKLVAVDDKPKNGMAAADATKDTVFSPAPTLLEMQQENLSRRLKSLKSLHGLSTQNDTIKSSDSVLENEISTSISEALNASSSSNSSLTSISSPQSDQDFDDAELNDPLKCLDEPNDEPSTSENKATPVSSFDDKMDDISENDFDLEPAELPHADVAATAADSLAEN